MRLAECHITRPEVQHCHHLWVFDLRRRAGDIRRPMSLASMHVVPLPMTVETACGVRAVCCHMVMVNAVEAAPHQVHQNRPMRLPRRKCLDCNLLPLLATGYHLPSILDMHGVQGWGGMMASGHAAGVGHEAPPPLRPFISGASDDG
jgi:hypothetical protein